MLETITNNETGYSIKPFHITKMNEVIASIEKQYGVGCWENLDEKTKPFIVGLKEALATQNPNQLQTFLKENYTKDPLRFGWFISDVLKMSGLKEDLFNYSNESHISTYLNTLKVGVCRHYSMIAKKIFEAIAPDHFADSELLYVCNHSTQHAYNLLLFENEKGEIEKQYIDITMFITEDALLRKEDDILNKNDELRVHNSIDEKTGNESI